MPESYPVSPAPATGIVSPISGTTATACQQSAKAPWAAKYTPGALRDLTNRECAVFLALEGHASDRRPHCWPGLPTLMFETEKALRTLKGILYELEAKGWIDIVHGGGRHIIGFILLRRAYVAATAADTPEAVAAARSALRVRKYGHDRPPRTRKPSPSDGVSQSAETCTLRTPPERRNLHSESAETCTLRVQKPALCARPPQTPLIGMNLPSELPPLKTRKTSSSSSVVPTDDDDGSASLRGEGEAEGPGARGAGLPPLKAAPAAPERPAGVGTGETPSGAPGGPGAAGNPPFSHGEPDGPAAVTMADAVEAVREALGDDQAELVRADAGRIARQVGGRWDCLAAAVYLSAANFNVRNRLRWSVVTARDYAANGISAEAMAAREKVAARARYERERRERMRAEDLEKARHWLRWAEEKGYRLVASEDGRSIECYPTRSAYVWLDAQHEYRFITQYEAEILSLVGPRAETDVEAVKAEAAAWEAERRARAERRAQPRVAAAV